MINPFVLLLLGLTVGILTGFFGVGGAFLLTPALNILGLHMVNAIGTGFFTLVGKYRDRINTEAIFKGIKWK